MGTLLMYRDLPGGPTKVKFADEIPRHCLCGQCGMISLSMFQDPGGHMFCDACLQEQSTKHDTFDIYCTYERKRIDINEMFEARDLITILREQYVDCPNQENCNTKVQLQNLRDHYVLCKQRVQCASCDQSSETKNWKTHVYASKSQQDIAEAAEKSSASVKTVKESGYQEEQSTPVLRSHNSGASKPSATQKYPELESAEESKYLREERGPPESDAAATETRHQVMSAAGGPAAPMQHSEGENGGPPIMQVCEFCQRNVKQSNMPRHRENCAKAPKPCVYCEGQIHPADMPSHIQHCSSNPDNVATTSHAANDRHCVALDAVNGVEGHRQPGSTGAENQCELPAADIPMLPILDVSLGELLEWHRALEEYLVKLGVSDDMEKFRYLRLSLSSSVLNELDDMFTLPPPTLAYECVLIALFKRSKTAREGLREEFLVDEYLQELPRQLRTKIAH
ncbi:uncharacterized protein [Dermacentor andersoni]|uniref:uncharacterized protein isoform X7 n=1 Tax=Dermacentor andersoni TaxID=34620 RepID=UPI0024165264|nr:uncharacterized protein LOC126544571 isoform X7 [Dermacentor andersoni]